MSSREFDNIEMPGEQPARLPTEAVHLEAPGGNYPALGPDPYQDDEPGGEFGIAAILHGLRRRWHIGAALGAVLGMAVAATAWVLLEAKYVTSGTLRIASKAPKLVFETEEGQNFDVYKRTQTELMRTRFVLVAALRDEKVAQLPIVQKQVDPIGWLKDEISIKFPGDGELVNITMEGDDPKAIAMLVNAVIDAYMREVVDVENNQRSERLQKLEEAYGKTEEKARRMRSDLKQLAEALGTGDSDALSTKQQLTLQQYAAIRGEQTRLQFELMRNQIRLVALESRLKAPLDTFQVSDAHVDREVSTHPEMIALRSRLSALELKIEEVEAFSRSAARIGVERQRLEAAKEELAEAENRLRKNLVELTREQARAELEQEAIAVRETVALQTEQTKQLSKHAQDLEQSAGQIGRSSVDLEMLRTEMGQVDGIVEQLGTEIETLRVELQSPDRISLIQRADEPKSRTSKGRVQAVIALGSLSFLAPLFLVAWWDSRSRRIDSATQFEKIRDMRVIGTLPHIPRGNSYLPRRRRHLQKAQLALRESVDWVRTLLIHESAQDRANVIMVTSAIRGEGKTTLATQLALSFARAASRVVLIDFDLRRPAAHRVLGVSNEPGVSEILRRETDLRDALQPTRIDGLWVVAAGECDEASLQGLTTHRVTECLEALRREFDVVLVDSPPVLAVVDALLVARHVDSAVFSALRDVSRMPKVEAARDRLSAIGVRIVGTVITGTYSEVYADEYGYLNPDQVASQTLNEAAIA